MSYKDKRGHTVPSSTDVASRQALLDLSMSINDIYTASNQSKAQEYANAMKSAGVTINADNPLYVVVSGALKAWDGRSWQSVGVYPDQWVSCTTNSAWSASSVRVRKIGFLVEIRGVIKRTGGNYSPGAWDTQVVVPSGYRPYSMITLAAANYSSGRSALYIPCVVSVDSGGVLRFYTEAYGETVQVEGVYISG